MTRDPLERVFTAVATTAESAHELERVVLESMSLKQDARERVQNTAARRLNALRVAEAAKAEAKAKEDAAKAARAAEHAHAEPVAHAGDAAHAESSTHEDVLEPNHPHSTMPPPPEAAHEPPHAPAPTPRNPQPEMHDALARRRHELMNPTPKGS